MDHFKEVIFPDSLPKLDLHGLDALTAQMRTKEFIRDNIKMRKEYIMIVHGIGKGILKTAVHQVLKHHRDVVTYKIYYFNNGATIVKVKKSIDK